MNVSIITMTNTYNYGATLQAFALQRYIESLGHNVQLIDHMSDGKEHRTISWTDFSRANYYKLLYKRKLEEGYFRFEEFYRKYMRMSVRYPTYQDLKENPPTSDVFISGSDQVWNPRDPKLERFLLDFVPDGRVLASYAASVADSSIPENLHTKYIDNLSRFDYVSVREKQGKELIAGFTNKNISINCDPIFLIDIWDKFEEEVNLKCKKYILCYMLYVPIWFDKWIVELKRKLGLPIVFVGLNGYRNIYFDYYVRDAGPEEFLWLIHNAELVVSSSFHGNAFSVKYGKPFFSLPDPNRPDRIAYLLSKFSLDKNIIFQPDLDVESKVYDFDKIDKIIHTEKNKSEEYLRRVIGDN